MNSYSEKDDWRIDPVDEYGESNRNIFAGYTIRDGNLLPSPTTKNEQGVLSLNEAGMQAMKQELMRGRAVSVSICADTSSPNQTGEGKYTNTNTWAAYVYDDNPANHQVAIVGWDDDYATSNFNQGVDGSGYFYVSYYDTSLNDPETMSFGMDLAGEEFYTHAYDYLPAYDKFFILEGKDTNVLSSANVFTAAYDEKITSVSTRTDELNSQVTFAIYLLNDESKNPTDGTLVEKFTRTYGYAGFHRADLEIPVKLKEGQRFSVVSSVTYVNGDGTTVYETVANKAIGQERAELLRGTWGERSQYGKAVVNPGESYLYEGGVWKDWAERSQTESFKRDAAGFVVDNFSIKAYAVPWDSASFPDVTDTTPHADEIRWLASSGISIGYPDKTFRPMLSVARQDAAVFLYRLNELN